MRLHKEAARWSHVPPNLICSHRALTLWTWSPFTTSITKYVAISRKSIHPPILTHLLPPERHLLHHRQALPPRRHPRHSLHRLNRLRRPARHLPQCTRILGTSNGLRTEIHLSTLFLAVFSIWGLLPHRTRSHRGSSSAAIAILSSQEIRIHA